MTDGVARFKDFTGDTDPIVFRVGSETFRAHDDIPLKHLGKLADLGSDLESGDAAGNATLKILRLFEKLLVPESYERFAQAVNGDLEVSIGVNRIRQIIPWMLEQYGLRPTEASSGSGDTSSESGASSMDGAALGESILENSNPFAASI